ncbi:hypothetical protein D3C81_1063170 [compost metagenome]
MRMDEIGYGDNGERPERNTLFERDAIGRLMAKVNRDARQDFEYDDADRLLSIQRHWSMASWRVPGTTVTTAWGGE